MVSPSVDPHRGSVAQTTGGPSAVTKDALPQLVAVAPPALAQICPTPVPGTPRAGIVCAPTAGLAKQARALGWDYADLVCAVLDAAERGPRWIP